MYDFIQLFSLRLVGEDDTAQFLSVETAVGEEFISECCLYLCERGCTGFDDLTGYNVGVDDWDMSGFE